MFKKIKEEILDVFNIDANQALILEMIFFKEYVDLNVYIPKLANHYQIIMQNLFRRDFIKYYEEELVGFRNVRNLCLTLKGENVIKALSEIKFDKEKEEKIVITVEIYFNEFWDTFPASDKWGPFKPTRSFKADKNGCNKKYTKLLLEEGYKHEDVIKALKYQINLFQKDSTAIENKMKFFQNTSTWLNQKTFVGYLELSNSEIEDTSSGLIL